MASNALRSQVAKKWQEAFQRLNRDEPGISGLMTYSQAFTLATDFLCPKDMRDMNAKKRDSYDMKTVLSAFAFIGECRKMLVLLETFLENIRKHFNLINEEIEKFMKLYEAESDVEHFRVLVLRLKDWFLYWSPPPELGPTMLSSYLLSFQTHLFSTVPSSFSRGFKELCASTLTLYSNDEIPSNSSLLQQNNPVWDAFETLGLIDRYESIIASVGYEFIEAHVVENCSDKWDKPMLEELRTWMSEKVVPWMIWIYARNATNPEEARTMLQGIGSRFDFHINKTLCDLRTKEIFDIIIDFPDSTGALHDLRDCLQRVDQRTTLVKYLRKFNQKRLLHPGADTKLILSQYVATIKCLRIVDPPGVLLFKVADPIRRYLRERPDTIRSIVANLVGGDETGDSLVDENEAIQPLQQPEAEDYNDPNWEPEPIDAGPEFRTNKPSDVISTLVSIYDSKDLFVKELQVLLAQRLLSIDDDSGETVEKERRNVEILKIRFGEVALQVCEVMMRDMTDSKRTDIRVQSQKDCVIHPTIISRHFWPTLDASEIMMPGQFQKLQDQYAHEYTVFKPDKKLKWLSHLGSVHIELQLQDRTVEVKVPPLEAAFIELFSLKDVWSLEELIAGVGSVDRSAAIKALISWADLGVVKETTENVFKLLETAEEANSIREPVRAAPTPELLLPAVSSMQQQQAEQMHVYWRFIEGMLTNLGTLPLDRIQTMLRFAPGYDQSIEQLANFMEAARSEELVSTRDGLWRLNR